MDFVFKGEKTMKKKLLITLLASACAVGCAAGLAACGSGDNGGNDGDKQLSSISAQITHDKWDGSNFVYNLNETIEISKSNFTVTAHYSDSSTQTVTDYALDTSSLPDDTSAEGTYQIILTYQMAMPLTYNVIVGKEDLHLSQLTVPENGLFTWTGEEISLYDKIPELKALKEAGKIEIDTAAGESTESATNVGDYNLSIKAADGYKEESTTLSWSIVQAEIDAPTLKSDGFTLSQNGDTPVYSVTYDGNQHSVQIEYAAGTEQYITVSGMNSEALSQTNAGQYTYTISTDGNHKFKGVSSDPQFIMVINRAELEITKEELTLGSKPYRAEGYTESDIVKPLPELFDTLFEITGRPTETTFIYVSNYNFTLTAKAAAENYRWKGAADDINTYLYENGTVEAAFNIIKATPSYSAEILADTATNVIIECELYDGLTVYGVVDGFTYSLTEASKTWLAENLGYVDANQGGSSMFKYSDNETAATVGEQVITVSYTPHYSNYEEIQITITIRVTSGGQP